MAEKSRFASDPLPSNKRKYDEPTSDSTPPSASTGRRTGFSSGPISPDSAAPAAATGSSTLSYNSVPPPPAADDVQAQVQNAKLRAQEIASRLLSGGSVGGGGGGVDGSGVIGGFDSKFSRVDNGGGFDSFDAKPAVNSVSSIPISSGYGQGTSKKIDVPNGRVGVIIGKGGETIKYLQLQSGAKIQVTRDMYADPNSHTRTVDLMGTPEQIAKAEQLINDVLAEAEAGGSAVISRRGTGQPGSGDRYVMKVPNNKVGLVIGKGGETIKSMQARTGAHIQVIPLHLPPGDNMNERNIHIDGTPEQIEAAKQLIIEATSENRMRSQGMSGGYSQDNYQSRHPPNWGAPGTPQMQQPGYGYPHPEMYSSPSYPYNMGQPQYGSYPPQSSGGQNSSWEQSAVPPSQHGGQAGYDYYNQQPPQQQQTPGGPSGAPDGSGYGYSQPPASYGQPGQGYSQDGYGGYHGHPSSGYGQPPHYDQQQGYNTAGYNNAANPSQEGHTASYGSQGDTTQAPSAVPPSSAGQQGYGTGYPQTGVQHGYGAPPVSQAGYDSQPPPPHAGYGSYAPPQSMPTGNPPPYEQAQQSLSAGGGYGQPPVAYSQPEAAAQQAPGYSAGAGQPAYGSAYGQPPTSQPDYGQPPPQYYNGGYQQPAAAAYSDNSGTSLPTSQPAASTDATKASPAR